MTFVIQLELFSGWTMCKRYVIVCNVVEEMNLVLLQEKTCCNAVNWRIAPSLIKEAALLVKMLKVFQIFLRSKPFKACNLEI
jgi:hypothetical protein